MLLIGAPLFNLNDAEAGMNLAGSILNPLPFFQFLFPKFSLPNKPNLQTEENQLQLAEERYPQLRVFNYQIPLSASVHFYIHS